MKFTGERVVPGQTDVNLMNEHLARYGFAESLCVGKRVLDAGCGVGYGSVQLGRSADEVVGLDNAHEALITTKRKYESSSLYLAEGDCRNLPFPDASFDVVVALEVIEHLEGWQDFLAEAKRVLTPSGQLIVSTPNKIYYQQTRTMPNYYHIHEFEYEEFRKELANFFENTTMFFENHSDASVVTPIKVSGVRTLLEMTSPEPQEAHFFVAVCSAKPLDSTSAFVYLPKGGTVLQEREQHVELLVSEIDGKQELLRELEQELRRLWREHLDRRKHVQKAVENLEAERAKEEESYRTLEADKAGRHRELEKCVGLLDDAEQRIVERTDWAKRVNQQLRRVRKQLADVSSSPVCRVGRRLRLAPDISPEDVSPPPPVVPETKQE